MAHAAAHVIVADESPAPAVLLVDDEPKLVRTLRRMIEPEGFRVLEAGERGAISAQLRHEP